MIINNIFYNVALTLLIIGGINWGLVGLMHLDLVAAIFGPLSLPARIVYIAVGVSAAYVLAMWLMKDSKA